MLFLHSHHIVDLYCWVDSQLPSTYTTGRPLLLNDSEIITVLIWSTVTLRQKTLRGIYTTLNLYHESDFNKLSSYSPFVRRSHHVAGQMFDLLSQLLSTTEAVKLLD